VLTNALPRSFVTRHGTRSDLEGVESAEMSMGSTRPNGQFLTESDTDVLCTLFPAASYAMALSVYRPLRTLDVFQSQSHPTKVMFALQIN
jgi:hypothetical protein